MSKKIMDIVSSREVAGREKKAWQKHGILVVGDDGRMSIKLESLPVGDGWNGWLSVFEQRDRQDTGGAMSTGPDGGDLPFAPARV